MYSDSLRALRERLLPTQILALDAAQILGWSEDESPTAGDAARQFTDLHVVRSGLRRIYKYECPDYRSDHYQFECLVHRKNSLLV
jgi:hypothetical protein